MRTTIFAAILLLASSSLFAATLCTTPTLTISDNQGDGCGGSVEFASANYSISSHTLSVVRYMDKSSPKLFSDCSGGVHIHNVSLTTPNVATDGTNHPTVVTFKDVTVAQVNESVNPTNESVQFNFTSYEINYDSGRQVATGSVRGTARAGTLSVAVVGGDGKSQTASHLGLTIRPGGITSTSVQLLSPNPPPIRAGIAKATTPANSPQLDRGTIEIRGPGGALISSYSFSGGVLSGNNLRADKVNLHSAAAIHQLP